MNTSKGVFFFFFLALSNQCQDKRITLFTGRENELEGIQQYLKEPTGLYFEVWNVDTNV